MKMMPNLLHNSNQFLALFLIVLNFNRVYSEIIVYRNTSSDKVVRVITDYELSIGSDIPDDGIMAYIVVAEPENACTQIKPPPKDPFNAYNNDTKYNWFVLVDRDYCVMDKKLKNVKDAGYSGVIVYNARLTQMNVAELDYQLVIDFPVLLVTHIDGRQIKSFYTYDKGYFAWFLNNSPFKLFPYLIPFLVVIGACIIVIISFMISQIIRCYNERKKRLRHRLAKRHLKKIPTINFKKGDHYEICAICLDEFQEGVKLRLLTCGHAYHIKCIDPWLTENRRNCPICKGKVVVPGITDSESDSENERNNNASERTPLLGNTTTNNQQTDTRSDNNLLSTLIFPVSRSRRSGRNTSISNQNNVPTTSNIVNNDTSVNITQPNQLIAFNTVSRMPGRRSRNSRLLINAEINSPQSPLNDQPSTSGSATMISIDEQQSNKSISSNTDTSSSGSSSNNGSNITLNSQQPTNSNYGSTNISRPRPKREDNIV